MNPLEISDIKARIKQCEDDSPEQDFWVEQLEDIRREATDVERAIFDEMNQGQVRHG